MNNHNPIQVLMEEHEIISSVEKLIPALNTLSREKKDSYPEKIKILLAFFREFSDHFHHHKEEEILFKTLISHPDFIANEIISELEEHHEMFRETLDEIEQTLDLKDFKKTQSLLGQYITNLLDHIAVENDELFIMAESLLGADELSKMYFQFEDIDRNLGLDRKKELIESLEGV